MIRSLTNDQRNRARGRVRTGFCGWPDCERIATHLVVFSDPWQGDACPTCGQPSDESPWQNMSWPYVEDVCGKHAQVSASERYQSDMPTVLVEVYKAVAA